MLTLPVEEPRVVDLHIPDRTLDVHTPPVKTCTRCRVEKPLPEFNHYTASPDNHFHWCRACHLDGKRRSVYRVSPSRYASLLAAQGGTCAICARLPSPGISLVIDHDHRCCPGPRSCGHCVRGLLCSLCNTGLGHLQDSVSVLVRAAAYLEHHTKGRQQ